MAPDLKLSVCTEELHLSNTVENIIEKGHFPLC